MQRREFVTLLGGAVARRHHTLSQISCADEVIE